MSDCRRHAQLWLAAVASAALIGATACAANAQSISGAALYTDIQHFDSFGIHRYGTPGAHAAFDWMGERLRRLGFKIADQRFTMPKQYFLDRATLTVGGATIAVMPQWWLADNKASFQLLAPIAAQNADATGKFVRLRLPYDQGAYLSKTQKDAFATAFQRNPAAVLVSIDHPSGEIFTYNVSQSDAPWPVPLILVPPKEWARLDAAEASGAPVSLAVKGQYRHNVPGRNVIGRLDRGKEKTLVVSTPVTSWFTSTCERGPGIAAFLATAKLAATEWRDANFVFVATGGHEIGHGGMELFLKDRAPRPELVTAWVHFGASLACYKWTRDGSGWASNEQIDPQLRVLLMSSSLAPTVERDFAGIPATRLVGERAAVGELREIVAAGYPNFVGMAGLHSFFHTPMDRAAMTGPAVLEPVVQAFATTMAEIVAGKR